MWRVLLQQSTIPILNTRDVAKVAGMNKSTDASFEQSQLQDEAALEKAVLALSIPGDDITYKTAGLTCDRTITVCFLDGGTVTGEDGRYYKAEDRSVRDL